jgi:mannose-6-phosphate isomerase-like protein (cupin superfamily)
MTPLGHSVQIESAKERLIESGGGYEIVHETPGMQLGVYVLVAPEADRQQPHDDDEVYVVLEGRGTLEVEGELIQLEVGQGAFVPAGADHRFVGYEQLVVLVIFDKRPA